MWRDQADREPVLEKMDERGNRSDEHRSASPVVLPRVRRRKARLCGGVAFRRSELVVSGVSPLEQPGGPVGKWSGDEQRAPLASVPAGAADDRRDETRGSSVVIAAPI